MQNFNNRFTGRSREILHTGPDVYDNANLTRALQDKAFMERVRTTPRLTELSRR